MRLWRARRTLPRTLPLALPRRLRGAQRPRPRAEAADRLELFSRPSDVRARAARGWV